jgi:ribosome-associated translation inhibitor RaiA
MPSSTIVTFRHIEQTGALEARAHEILKRLRHEGATRCHLTVDGGLDHRGDGARYAVSIQLSVPGAQIHADSVDRNGAGHGDAFAALNEAYLSAKRQLSDLQKHRRSSLMGRARSMMGMAERSKNR